MDYLNKISENFIILFIFILVISGNYIGELLPCRIQYTLQNNMIYKHFFGILTMFFFVLLALPEYKDGGVLSNLGISVFFYAFFLLLAKTHYKFWMGIMVSLAILYIISLYRKELDNNDYKNKILLYENILGLFILILSIIGVIIYYHEKKLEYKNKFSLYKFIIGTVSCKHNKSKTFI